MLDGAVDKPPVCHTVSVVKQTICCHQFSVSSCFWSRFLDVDFEIENRQVNYLASTDDLRLKESIYIKEWLKTLN